MPEHRGFTSNRWYLPDHVHVLLAEDSLQHPGQLELHSTNAVVDMNMRMPLLPCKQGHWPRLASCTHTLVAVSCAILVGECATASSTSTSMEKKQRLLLGHH